MSALRHLVRVPSPSLIVAVAALLVATTGAALAAIPDANDVIHGCITNRTGALRVIDSEAGQTCTSKETALNWNQTGPPGDPASVDPYYRFGSGFGAATANCDQGDFATGGGGRITDGTGALWDVAPVSVSGSHVLSWGAASRVQTDSVVAFVICVDNAP